jgi:Curli production assembly/transport component CsgG
MKKNLFVKSVFVLLGAALLPALASAQDKATIRVSTIKPTPSLEASLNADQKLELGRIVESLDSQLTDRIAATHKFDIVGGSDLTNIIGNQDLENSGNFDSKTAAKVGALNGAKYVLVTTVDNYQDNIKTQLFEGTDRSGTRREFIFSAVGKIYDSTTGKMLDSANFSIAHTNIEVNLNSVVKNGNLSDEMMTDVSRDMAGKIANRVAAVVFPPTVIDVTGIQVTIDWGSGMPISDGDEWEVCVQKLKKGIPVLVSVGKVKIVRVDEASSTGEIIGENLGIAEDCVLRKPQ